MPHSILRFGERAVSFTSQPTNGVSVNKADLAVYLEWWDPETGTWSEPLQKPPKIPKCNSMGKTVVVHRFPRQLDPVTDQAEIRSIINAGGPNYSWDHGKVKYTTMPFYGR